MVAALLPLATAEGYMRLLLDAGPGMGALLRRTRTALHEADTPMDPLQDDHLQRLIQLAGETSDDGGADPTASGAVGRNAALFNKD